MLTRKHIIDAINDLMESAPLPESEEEGLNMLVDAILDAMINNTASPRACEELERVKAGEQ